MFSDADQIKMLRAALQASPNNVPLRLHIAQTLLSLGDPQGAEKEFLDGLAFAPTPQDAHHGALTVGLARSYYQQEKDPQALVVLENFLKAEPDHSEALALNAKILMRCGQGQAAVEQFRRALEQDKSLADSTFAEQIKVTADGPFGQNGGWDDDLSSTQVSPDQDGENNASIERPTITFEQVGGMEALKEEIRLKIIYPLTHADMYKAYGQQIGGGILMYGPPGCGKTHIARATAGEIRAGFVSVAISDILDMWLGNSEKNLHEIFEQARRNAPCVLFFDEVDALASRRSDVIQSSGRQIINQFLTELDGVQYSNDGVLILAATNAPWYLDSAFRRPGRFDRILFVQPPDLAARAVILRLLCKGKPVEDIDFTLLGKKTERFSGADLKAVVDRAVEKKLQAAMKAGIPKPLNTQDLLQAAKSVNPSTREWFGTAKNYATHANQDGTYDDILTYLQQR
jgi:transitional endoplasmic reticulum ATPase